LLGAEAGRGYSVIPLSKATNFILSYSLKKSKTSIIWEYIIPYLRYCKTPISEVGSILLYQI
ncbi:hypothetical protein ABEW03_02895, partial [Virgibacillus pantothenticus]|uniref:hypothetical protein n=1 Tax=Virgibacillus pantothenticus TaxID=1473 RepID=UPI003D29D3B2